MSFTEDLTVEDAVKASALKENAAVLAKNAAIQTGNMLPGKESPLLPLVVSEETQKNQITILKNMGFKNGKEVGYFAAEADANPQLKQLFSSFEKEFANDPKYKGVLTKIGQQVLADGQKLGFDKTKAGAAGTGILDKLAVDLQGKNGPELIKQLRERPAAFEAKLDDYAAGKVGILDMIAQPAAPAAATATARPAATKQQPSARPATATPAPAAPIAVAAAATTTTPSAGATPAPVADPIAAGLPPKASPAAAPAPAQAANDPAYNASPELSPQEKFLQSIAQASDVDIKTKLSKDDVKILAFGMADKAKKDFGVEDSVVNGFKTRMENGTKLGPDGKPVDGLLDQITANMRNNPDFVRQLAKKGLDKTPPSEGLKQAGQMMMTEAMANPEKLADDKYVKGMTSKMSMADSGLGQMFGGMFDKLKQWLGPWIDKIKEFFGGFFGGKSILSMKETPGSMLPTVMVEVGNFNSNMSWAASDARYDPSLMTAMPIMKDGKPTHTEAIKTADGKPAVDDKGKPLTRELPNTAEFQTADGKSVKVIPAIGQLQAMQKPGSYDQTGKWQGGNFILDVVTGITPAGSSAKLSRVEMTPAQFDVFKKDMEARSKSPENPQGRTYPTQAYTESDYQQQYGTARLPVVRIDSKTGQPADPVEMAAPGIQPSGAVTSPVQGGQVITRPLDTEEERRRRNMPAANGMDYSAQA